MKLRDYKELQKYTSTYDLANLFTVHECELNDTSSYVYDIMKTVYFDKLDDTPEAFYDHYVIKLKDTWPLISHKLYNTTKLWWMLLKLNSIINPFVEPEVGKSLRYLSEDQIRDILATIRQV